MVAKKNTSTNGGVNCRANKTSLHDAALAEHTASNTQKLEVSSCEIKSTLCNFLYNMIERGKMNNISSKAIFHVRAVVPLLKICELW